MWLYKPACEQFSQIDSVYLQSYLFSKNKTRLRKVHIGHRKKLYIVACNEYVREHVKTDPV